MSKKGEEREEFGVEKGKIKAKKGFIGRGSTADILSPFPASVHLLRTPVGYHGSYKGVREYDFPWVIPFQVPPLTAVQHVLAQMQAMAKKLYGGISC